MRLRTLQESDLPDLIRLTECAGWNQTREDWLRSLRLEPDGCFGIEDAGTVISSASVITYGGGKLAWIGMVLTLPEHRGRGYARDLMRESLKYCGSATVRLDASDMGKPIYDKFGFQSECFVERWLRKPGPAAPASVEVGELRYDPVLDAEIFGAERTQLLAELEPLGGASEPGGGYCFVRPGRLGEYMGPCVANDEGGFERLLTWFISRRQNEANFVDLFPDHPFAAAVATRLGFQPVRRLTRMVMWPAPVAQPDPRICGIAGFEYG